MFIIKEEAKVQSTLCNTICNQNISFNHGIVLFIITNHTVHRLIVCSVYIYIYIKCKIQTIHLNKNAGYLWKMHTKHINKTAGL